jgi:DNA repair photolyase
MSEHTPPHSTDPAKISGRGAQINPHNRFLKLQMESDLEQVEHDEDYLDGLHAYRTEYFSDDSQSIISENDSPDIPFRYSVNPYRGCAHGCAYCYARPTHEYLGLSAGIDFESKIFVKLRAPDLLREHLSKKNWQPESIVMSGVTDCYQPIDRKLELTRRCIEVATEFNQPLSIITKNALVTRDIDLLKGLASKNLTRVAVSITSLDQSLTRVLEPRTSSPEAKLRAIRELSAAGIPVTVMAAPIIPGLNDSEIPAILQAAVEHGASYAGYILVRLPLTVRPIFLDWLNRHFPNKRERVESLIRSTREGQYNQSKFGQRMRGSGEYADHLSKTFKLFAKRFGLHQQPPPLDLTQFRRPPHKTGQLNLFDF